MHACMQSSLVLEKREHEWCGDGVAQAANNILNRHALAAQLQEWKCLRPSIYFVTSLPNLAEDHVEGVQSEAQRERR